MKKITSILVIIIMMSCKCNLNNNKPVKTVETKNLLDCPENGICTIKILENKSLQDILNGE